MPGSWPTFSSSFLHGQSHETEMSSSPILLITGANTGLGFETVKALCSSSKAYTILLGGRSLEKATAAAQQARGEFPNSPSTVTPVQVDIEDDESISKLYDLVADKYGRMDILINNAGDRAPSSTAKKGDGPWY